MLHTAHVSAALPMPTANPPDHASKAATVALARLFPEPGIRYARAGVVLTGIRPARSAEPIEIFKT